MGIAGLSRGFTGNLVEVAFGILWARLWASWGLFRVSWECHGAACGVLGRLLAVWGVSWGRKSWNSNLCSTFVGPSCDTVGALLGRLGRLLGRLGALLGRLGARLGASRAVLERS